MFVIESKEIEYCPVIKKCGQEAKIIQGASYQQKLFTPGEIYSQENKKFAINKGRRLSLEGKALCLVVESKHNIRLWYHDEQLKKLTKEDDIVSYVNMPSLVRAMRDIGGVKIMDRQYRLRKYSRCFIGSEAVSWIIGYFQISEPEAVSIGQRLISEKYIHHVTDDHDFKNEYLFYRFYWDD
ncbi:MAG: hypothetical protein QNJ51_19045 [Calothrix sp. MO_167.B12]|nr:hypothetical protein [Calothrix sp. MO_167.B12]